MEKSNSIDEITETQKPLAVSPETLAIMGRKVVLVKRFFAWISVFYFVTALMASGNVFASVTLPLARAGKIVLFFAVCVLLHTIISNWLLQSGERYAKLRPLSLGIMAILFILSVIASSPFFH